MGESLEWWRRQNSRKLSNYLVCMQETERLNYKWDEWGSELWKFTPGGQGWQGRSAARLQMLKVHHLPKHHPLGDQVIYYMNWWGLLPIQVTTDHICFLIVLVSVNIFFASCGLDIYLFQFWWSHWAACSWELSPTNLLLSLQLEEADVLARDGGCKKQAQY